MKNLVLITSVISTSTNPLSYTNTRSVFSPEERFQDTVKTIESVRQKIPDSKILLVECSDLGIVYEAYFKKHVDYYLNLYENEDMRNNTTSQSKALGEGTMTISAMNYIFSNEIQFDNFIKISGRYWLNDFFDYSDFDNDKIVVKYIDGNPENVNTCVYKLPKNVLPDFLSFLNSNMGKMYECIGYEVLFAQFVQKFNYCINTIEKIGVNGYISVARVFYDG